MSELCPCCGEPLKAPSLRWYRRARVLVWDSDATVLTDREARMWDALWNARNQGKLASNALLGIMFKDDPEGGPVSLSQVSILASRIRCKIAGAPIVLRAIDGHKGGFWLAHKCLLPASERPRSVTRIHQQTIASSTKSTFTLNR